MEAMLGMIVAWPVPWVPRGWMACNGQLLPIQQYTALYSLIGVTYGGDGRTTFALPDLRGRAPVGAPQMPMVPTPAAFGSQTASTTASGSVSMALGVDNLPAHSHAASFAGNASPNVDVSVDVKIPALSAAGSTATNTPGPNTVLAAPGLATARIFNTGAADTTLLPFKAEGPLSIPTPAGSVTVTNTGEGKPITAGVSVPVTVSTLQPSLYLNFIIAVEGLYPDRP